MSCRKHMELMEGKSFTIPKLKVNLFKTDPTTAIIDILNVSEEKFIGCAEFVDLNINTTSESIEFDYNNTCTYIMCKHLTPNKQYKIRMQYINNSGFLCCSKIKSFMTLPNAPILSSNIVDVTDCTVTVKLADPNIEWYIEIAEITENKQNIAIWKEYNKTNRLAFQLISDLKCDSDYQIRVRYKNKSGLSAYSDILTIQTKLPKPPTFSFDNITRHSVAIKFDYWIPSHLVCCIKIIRDNNLNKGNYKIFSVSNVNTFYCNNLKPNTKYNITAYYPMTFETIICTETMTFETSDCMTREETKKLKELIDNYTNYEYKKKWKLLYQGSKHGFNAKSFYNKCDMKQNTICIIRTDENEIFGAFTSILWDKSKMGNNKRQLQNDLNSFMFSVRSNKLSKPLLFPVTQNVGYERGYLWIFDSERFKIYLKDNCNLNCLSMFECHYCY
eukprot:414105_1